MNTTLPEWAQLEGLSINERYVAGRCLATFETGAQYECLVGGSPDPARLVRMVALDQANGQQRLSSWQSAQHLDHANLIRIFEAGTAKRDGTQVGYCVTEAPDESLDGGLAERALEPAEALQVVEAIARGLQYLHAHDYVHRTVEPANIFAIGEQIKLSADAVPASATSSFASASGEAFQAPEVGTAGYSAASDMWSLGITIFQALTREFPPANNFFRISSLPAPFPTVLLHCLEPDPAQRWSAQDVLQNIATSNASTIAPEAQQPPARPVQPSNVPLQPAVAVDSPATLLPAYERRRYVLDETPTRPWARYLTIAAAVLFIGLVWFLFRKKPDSVQTQPLPPPTDQPVASKPLAHTEQPIQHAPAIAAATPPPATGNWRVVAFTFNRATDAAHKAATVNARTPGLRAEVFSPEKGRSPYLVSLGGWMTVEEAKRLRVKAISLGLPHDTYAQNFHH